MNIVIYARYSSDRQTEQSIEGQLKECYEYARRNGYTVVGEYIDRAISGTTDHRPEFLRMIADGDKKFFQAVLVYQLDRFARNRYDSATYKAKLKKNGIRVLSARENISDDASGVLMEAVLEGMAEYYQCVTNRRDKSCQKKTVSKAYIEDLVVTETRKLLTKENIDRIAKEVVRLCEQEKDTENLKRLKKLLKENERATENLFKALESGQIVDVIAERISQKKREHNELEQQILVETSSHPTPTVNEVRFFLNPFRKGDVNDLKYRQALVDTFVNKIYLYDDKMTVLYNTQDSHSDVTIDDLSSSRVVLVDFDPSNPNPFSLEGSMRKVLLWQEVKLYAVVMRKPSGSSHTVTEFTIRSMIMRRYLSSSIRPPLNSVNQ
ncbi:recombinase family protein [Intestinimonas massiliensis (ex Afouda et al. 2020)]|uniref:recombinase family protein n=1 Tax=Intestinimonas massiliensis (ex Afouda et al. 2020) TaxID=1673721 RepID=UPI003F68A162